MKTKAGKIRTKIEDCKRKTPILRPQFETNSAYILDRHIDHPIILYSIYETGRPGTKICSISFAG